jgi:ribonuclease Z
LLGLTILGCNSAVPSFGRNPTAQVLQTQKESFLIDCGEGTQMQMAKYNIRRSKVSRIFISHLHGDHYFGLIGLINSMSLLNRTQDLHLYAPKELEEIIGMQMRVANSQLSFKLFFHPVTEEGLLVEDNSITIHTFRVQHRIECWGFLFREKKKPRSVNGEKVKVYEIPTRFYEKLQEGENYTTKDGTVILNEELTRPGIRARSYAYCADTVYDESLIDKVRGVDMLYHEATYLSANEDRAKTYFHSTTTQAASIAQKAEVKRLIIGHFSSRYEKLDEFLSEARSVFKDTVLAQEGTCYKI